MDETSFFDHKFTLADAITLSTPTALSASFTSQFALKSSSSITSSSSSVDTVMISSGLTTTIPSSSSFHPASQATGLPEEVWYATRLHSVFTSPLGVSAPG
eukprot:413536_1